MSEKKKMRPITKFFIGAGVGTVIGLIFLLVVLGINGQLEFHSFGSEPIAGQNESNEILPVESFSEGYAVVKLGGQFGYIDTKGNLAIPIQFDEAESFKNGIAKVKINNGDEVYDAYINTTGQVVFDYRDYEDKYTEIYNCSEGLIGVSKYFEGSYNQEPYTAYGYINLQGEEVIPLQREWSFWPEWKYSSYEEYLDISTHPDDAPMDFHEGGAFVCWNDGNDVWALINTSGGIINDSIYLEELRQHFSNGIAIVVPEDGRSKRNFYLLTSDGRETNVDTIQQGGLKFGRYEEGLIAYYDYGGLNLKDTREEHLTQGYINEQGKLVIDFSEYSECELSDFSDGMAPIIFIGKDGKEYCTYLDKSGQFLIEPQSKYVYEPIIGGYGTWLEVGTDTIYIVDENFNILTDGISIDTSFGVDNFSDGYFLTKINGKETFIDINGNPLEISKE